MFLNVMLLQISDIEQFPLYRRIFGQNHRTTQTPIRAAFLKRKQEILVCLGHAFLNQFDQLQSCLFIVLATLKAVRLTYLKLFLQSIRLVYLIGLQ